MNKEKIEFLHKSVELYLKNEGRIKGLLEITSVKDWPDTARGDKPEIAENFIESQLNKMKELRYGILETITKILATDSELMEISAKLEAEGY